MIKLAYIKKIKNKYHVFSEKGKNMGVYNSLKAAKKRLQQIEFFKHKKASTSLDLSSISNLSLSAILRELYKQSNIDTVKNFLNIFNKYFKENILDNVKNPEDEALIKTLNDFDKDQELKINKKLLEKISFFYFSSAKIKLAKKIDINNLDTVVDHVREYMNDNRDSYLDHAEQQSFAPFLPTTRQYPYDNTYNNSYYVDDTRENKQKQPLDVTDYSDINKGDIPYVGTYDDQSGIKAPKMEPLGISPSIKEDYTAI